MGLVFLISVVAAIALLALWYLWFARYNRRKGTGVLRWVEAACAGRGRVTRVSWNGPARLLVEVRFPPHMFERARVVVRLLPRPWPVNWALSRWRQERETLAFEADLDSSPRFHLEVRNHRWAGPNSRSAESGNWLVSRPGPIVLTSRSVRGQEAGPVVHALMASREKNFVAIRFSPESPHFSATLELDSLPDGPPDAEWLQALRELAAGASTSRQ